MASTVNDIAATFATASITSCSSSSSSSSTASLPSLNQNNFSAKSLCISWNPHTTFFKSQKSSLLNLYGPPGPPPRSLHSISTVHRPPYLIANPIPIPIGYKLPDITFSYLKRNDAVQSITLFNLCQGKRVVLVGVSAAFSPRCTRFVKRIQSVKAKHADLIACVAVNDVFVMRAWGENLGVGERLMMLSDGGGELCGALGVSVDTSNMACLGLGVRSRRFCLTAVNGVITSVDFDDEDDKFIFTK